MRLCSQLFSQSSLVPLAKIASAPTRFQRIFWVIVTTAMFLCLCICIALVTIQYCKHQTVFQLDYSGSHSLYDQMPGITVCQDPTEMLRLFAHASRRYGWPQVDGDSPWGDARVNVELLKHTTVNGTRPSGAIGHHMPIGQLMWNTETSAKSPLYRMFHNFTVSFHIKSAKEKPLYQLFVLEQIPNRLYFMCTTFELKFKTLDQPWPYVEIKIEQDMKTGAIATDTVDSTEPKGATFIIITHERGELPFSAYDRSIYTPVAPSSFTALYYSKMLMKRTNTVRNPCHNGVDSEWLAKNIQYSNNQTHYFDYIDHKRLTIRKMVSWPTGNLPYKPRHSSMTRKRTKDAKNSKTVPLFNTVFLYTREACGWAFCCLKVAELCNCTCSMDWSLSTGSLTCPNTECERVQCSDAPIPYEKCPIPCSLAKFVKQNMVTTTNAPESRLLSNESILKLIRSENVQFAEEEEIYSIAKLFSEIGGLSSLFIGFSYIFIFELLEAILLLERITIRENKTKKASNVYCCSSEVSLAKKPQDSRMYFKSSKKIIKQTEVPQIRINNMGFEEDVKDLLTLPVYLRSGLVPIGQQLKSTFKEDCISTYLVADSRGLTKSQLMNLMKQGRLRFCLMSEGGDGS